MRRNDRLASPELVAGMLRNGWPDWTGTGGRLGPEYAEIARHPRHTKQLLVLAPAHYEGESTDRVIRPTPLGLRARLQLAGLSTTSTAAATGSGSWTACCRRSRPDTPTTPLANEEIQRN